MARQQGGPKRGTRWIDTIVAQVLTAGTAVNVSLLGSLGADDIPGLTVIRTIVRLYLAPNTTPSGFGGTRLLVGAGVATGDAFSAGALPDLDISTDFPVRGWTFKTVGVAMYDTDHISNTLIEGDFRSMRKLDEQTEYFLQMLTNTAVGISLAQACNGLIRVLVKLQ